MAEASPGRLSSLVGGTDAGMDSELRSLLLRKESELESLAEHRATALERLLHERVSWG